jgi:hypothetical protein
MPIADLKSEPMMNHLIATLEAGHSIGHYGRLVFAMVGRHFLEPGELISLLEKDPEVGNQEDAVSPKLGQRTVERFQSGDPSVFIEAIATGVIERVLQLRPSILSYAQEDWSQPLMANRSRHLRTLTQRAEGCPGPLPSRP